MLSYPLMRKNISVFTIHVGLTRVLVRVEIGICRGKHTIYLRGINLSQFQVGRLLLVLVHMLSTKNAIIYDSGF